jgi:hypothetical protein
MFFRRAFMIASSALIVSTYFALSTFEAGARDFAAADGAAGFAAAADAAAGADLSKHANLAADSDIDLHPGVWAIALWDSAPIASSMTKNFIAAPFLRKRKPASKCGHSQANCDYSVGSKSFPDSPQANCP